MFSVKFLRWLFSPRSFGRSINCGSGFFPAFCHPHLGGPDHKQEVHIDHARTPSTVHSPEAGFTGAICSVFPGSPCWFWLDARESLFLENVVVTFLCNFSSRMQDHSPSRVMYFTEAFLSTKLGTSWEETNFYLNALFRLRLVWSRNCIKSMPTYFLHLHQ